MVISHIYVSLPEGFTVLDDVRWILYIDQQDINKWWGTWLENISQSFKGHWQSSFKKDGADHPKMKKNPKPCAWSSAEPLPPSTVHVDWFPKQKKNPKTSPPREKKKNWVPHLLDIIPHELISILEDPHALTEGLVVPDTSDQGSQIMATLVVRMNVNMCKHTHRIHVWNIYQHLPHKWSNVGKYTIHRSYGIYKPMSSMGFWCPIFQTDPLGAYTAGSRILSYHWRESIKNGWCFQIPRHGGPRKISHTKLGF